MTTKIQLNAQLRNIGNNQAKSVRAAGFIPAVIYGFGKANQNIKVKKHDFEKVFAVAGEFNLVDLSIDEALPAKVIIKDIQRDGLTDGVIHIDFYQVDMTKKITTEIPLNFIGEVKAIKELGGTLVKNMVAVEVECLPGDLVSHIDVDISVLANFDQFIRLHDLVLPQGIFLAQETNEAVVGAVETKIEEAAPKAAAAAPIAGQAAAPASEKTGAAGFTLIELLVVISIIGFLTVAAVVVFNIVRMNARDAVRVGNIATISRALAMYLNDSKTGYPASIGECLRANSGVGAELKAAQVILAVPLDPLWPTAAPAHTNGVPNAGQTNFCYFYFSEFNNQYKISFFLESNSKSGNAGINISVVNP